MPPSNDLDRLRREYAERERRLAGSDLYSPFNPSSLFAQQQRQRAVLKLLRCHGFDNLAERTILEMGCGSGGVLAEMLTAGAMPRRMWGVDILPARLAEAHARLPATPLACADGQKLPFPDRSCDLAAQFTAFSSILDSTIHRNIAAELRRVLKPEGLILWYDFWLNPTNRQTRGIPPAEVRALFPGCAIDFHRVTLAPPLARRIAPHAWGVAVWLESLRIFNSHYLAAIRPI